MLTYLLNLIFGNGCRHKKLGIIKNVTVMGATGTPMETIVIGTHYHLQCEDCGDVIFRESPME